MNINVSTVRHKDKKIIKLFNTSSFKACVVKTCLLLSLCGFLLWRAEHTKANA